MLDLVRNPNCRFSHTNAHFCSVSVTFTLPHVTNKDTTLHGYDIPKDAIIIANLYSAHIDPNYWPDPELFNPERFLDSNGALVRKDGLVPFGDGNLFQFSGKYLKLPTK